MFSSLTLVDIIFYSFALVIISSAIVVVFSKNILYSAFALLFTFFGVAGFYVLLSADFLAVVQLLIYVGGILVLILFGVMLTNNVISVDIKSETMQVFPASIIVAILAGVLCGAIYVADWFPAKTEISNQTSTVVEIGNAFVTTWLLPFEVASIVLLVALIGAVMIARKK